MQLDHIVIGAKDLSAGRQYLQEQFGVDVSDGGEHLLMGTHNLLMQIGENIFCEVIAINPALASPKHPRWFGLDDPFVASRLEKGPKLLTWVVNSADLDTLLKQSRFDFGVSTQLSRDDLKWLFAVPDDGRLLAAGLLPYILQWQTTTHPAQRMPDLACRLNKIAIYHPCIEWVAEILASISAESLVSLNSIPRDARAYFTVGLDTPLGYRELSSL